MCVVIHIGATRAYHYIMYSTITDTGDYHCQVKNLYGMADSYTARVTIKSGFTTGITTHNYLVPRNLPDDIKYPPANLGLLSNTPSSIEGSRSTPTSLDKSLKIDPEKCLFGPSDKHVSLPTKDFLATGIYT